MVDTAMELSKELRDKDGEWKCEIVIALTHARVTNVGFFWCGRADKIRILRLVMSWELLRGKKG
jgi:hypothetical protein